MEPITIKLTADKIFGTKLAKLNNLLPLMRMIASDLKDSVEKNFIAEGRPKKWVELAKRTIEERIKQGYWKGPEGRGKILQRKGGGSGLLGSFVTNYDSETASISTNKEYAAIHQFGGEIKQGERQSLYVQNRYKRGAKKGKFKKGTEAGKGFLYKARTIRIPARPFMVLPDEDLEGLNKTVSKYLES